VSSDPIKCLLVVRGVDTGGRLALSEQVKVVGRARDAHLVLTDGTVSRHHLQLRATEAGAYVHACGDASPFLHNGQATSAAQIRVGDSLLVGNTLLLLVDTDDRPPTHDIATTNIPSLLTGVAADVRGLAAIFALNEALLAAVDAPAIEAALASWAKVNAECDTTEVVEAGGKPPEATDPKPVVETAASDGGTRILVPTDGAPTRWFAFTTKVAPHRVTDSLRRLLVLAAALCASRLVQSSLLRAAEEQGESFRRQAVGSAHAFLGSSAAAEQLARMIPKLAASDVTVLLLGETGVGKTFVARLIHESGPRKGEPLRIINCASIPENLIESELFGHERGAFTGAVSTQRGVFETAGGGTLLLDEVGELPLAGQAKLLRVLEDRRFERIGSNRALHLNARIIAATNRDLESMVATGAFRSDLFFRLSILRAVVPPLRERGDDLLLLARRILADLASGAGRRIDGFSPDALEAIRRYPWPGNVRELRNVIEHALVLGDGPVLEASDFPAAVRYTPRAAADAYAFGAEEPTLVELPMNEELLHVKNREAALLRSAGNKTRAAALLGIRRTTLYKK